MTFGTTVGHHSAEQVSRSATQLTVVCYATLILTSLSVSLSLSVCLCLSVSLSLGLSVALIR